MPRADSVFPNYYKELGNWTMNLELNCKPFKSYQILNKINIMKSKLNNVLN